MSELISVGLGILFLATALTITSPLIDKVLTTEVLSTMEDALDGLEFFIGSDNLNTFLILITTILLFIVFRFAFSFFNSEGNK